MTDTAVLPPRNRIPPHLREPKVLPPADPEALREAADALRLNPERPLFKIEHSDQLPRKPLPWYVLGRAVIYFLDCDRYTKIGHAKDIQHRLDGFETHNPLPMTLWAVVPGDYALERKLHAEFAEERYRREWFILPDDVKAVIREWVLREGGRVLE